MQLKQQRSFRFHLVNYFLILSLYFKSLNDFISILYGESFIEIRWGRFACLCARCLSFFFFCLGSMRCFDIIYFLRCIDAHFVINRKPDSRFIWPASRFKESVGKVCKSRLLLREHPGDRCHIVLNSFSWGNDWDRDPRAVFDMFMTQSPHKVIILMKKLLLLCFPSWKTRKVNKPAKSAASDSSSSVSLINIQRYWPNKSSFQAYLFGGFYKSPCLIGF